MRHTSGNKHDISRLQFLALAAFNGLSGEVASDRNARLSDNLRTVQIHEDRSVSSSIAARHTLNCPSSLENTPSRPHNVNLAPPAMRMRLVGLRQTNVPIVEGCVAKQHGIERTGFTVFG